MKDAIKYLEDTLVTGNNTDDVIAVLAWKISNFSPEQQAYICAGEIYLGDNLVLFIPPEEEETVSGIPAIHLYILHNISWSF